MATLPFGDDVDALNCRRDVAVHGTAGDGGLSPAIRAAILAAAEATEESMGTGFIPTLDDFGAEDDDMEGDGPPAGWNPGRRSSSLGGSFAARTTGRRTSLTAL